METPPACSLHLVIRVKRYTNTTTHFPAPPHTSLLSNVWLFIQSCVPLLNHWHLSWTKELPWDIVKWKKAPIPLNSLATESLFTPFFLHLCIRYFWNTDMESNELIFNICLALPNIVVGPLCKHLMIPIEEIWGEYYLCFTEEDIEAWNVCPARKKWSQKLNLEGTLRGSYNLCRAEKEKVREVVPGGREVPLDTSAWYPSVHGS